MWGEQEDSRLPPRDLPGPLRHVGSTPPQRSALAGPTNSNTSAGRLSVLSPLGTSRPPCPHLRPTVPGGAKTRIFGSCSNCFGPSASAWRSCRQRTGSGLILHDLWPKPRRVGTAGGLVTSTRRERRTCVNGYVSVTKGRYPRFPCRSHRSWRTSCAASRLTSRGCPDAGCAATVVPCPAGRPVLRHAVLCAHRWSRTSTTSAAAAAKSPPMRGHASRSTSR